MRISRSVLAAVVAMAVFALVASMASAETITGRVTNATGQPVAAQIQVTDVLAAGCPQTNPPEITARSDGTFTLDGPPSIYALRVTAPVGPTRC